MNTLAPSFFKSIILILAGNEDMYKSLDEFKLRPDTTTNNRIICPCAPEKLKYNVVSTLAPLFLAQLSRRLIGELIVYPWSGVRRRPSYVVRRPSSSTMLKHLVLRNHLAVQSQILCGASLGRGNEILYTASGSHDQDGRHAHIR